MSGEKDPSNNNDRNGKREVTINVNLDIKIFPRLRTRWRSRWFPGGHPPFGTNPGGPSPPFPEREPNPDSPDYDDTKPFRFDDDFRFRVDEFGDDDYFDEEGQS